MVNMIDSELADTKRGARLADLPVRLVRKIEVVDGHWLWTKPNPRNGYAYVGAHFPGEPNRRWENQPAHRVTYELLIRVIPEGLQLDHTCEHRQCVAPACLDEVTAAENQRRGSWRQLHCRKRGHLFTPDNTYIVDGPRGPKKRCRACGRVSEQKREDSRRARIALSVPAGPRPVYSLGVLLTDSMVGEMRTLSAETGISAPKIASQYGVSADAVRSAVSGLTFAHLPGAVRRPRRVPPGPTGARLRALGCLGWCDSELAAQLGCARGFVDDLRRPERSADVDARTALRVEQMYEELKGEPGPSRVTRLYAETHGWLSPEQWETSAHAEAAA